jgi:hypothetical protein
MAKRSSWKRRYRQLELLESREAPTALAPAGDPLAGLADHAEAQKAALAKVEVFRGTEQVKFGPPTTQSSIGPASLTGTVSGSATGLGNFKGQITNLVAFDWRSFSATQTFQAANGDKLFATINGSYHHRIYNSTATATLSITGGTGRFANATGHGIVGISPILATDFPNSGATLSFLTKVRT